MHAKVLHIFGQILNKQFFKIFLMKLCHLKNKSQKEINPFLLKIASSSTMQTSLESIRWLFYITAEYCYELTAH